ncbi:MAG: hypothetical protein AAGC72_14935 [Planctomycetota bacterium]
MLNLMQRAHASLPLVAVLLGALVFLAGCQSSPPGRRPVGQTTDAERRSPQQQPTSLTEFRDQVPAELLQQLWELPEISEIPGPVTILMGDINNKTGIVSTNDYEYVTSGIRGRLINSRSARDKLYFVEQRARVERLAERERVATNPPPGQRVVTPGGGVYYVPDYDASRTFALTMDVYRIGRGNTNLYSMEVMLVSMGTNRIVFRDEYQMKQVSD